jgi:diacylglycerol O-acyltransferase / wax synthase
MMGFFQNGCSMILASRKKMSSVDTAWLRMDSPGNLMMIVGVSVFSKPISADVFRQEIQQHFLPYSRFRSRVVSDFSGAWWQEQEVDLNKHVVCLQLPPLKKGEHNNKAALQELVSQLSSQPLDPDLPLWQMHLVDGYHATDRGKARQALIIRIHHCIADGVSLVSLFMSMFGQEAEGAVFADEELHQHDQHWQQVFQPITRASYKAIEMSTTLLNKYFAALSKPGQVAEEVVEDVVEQMLDWGHSAGQLARDIVNLSTMSEDSWTSLKGKPCGKKHVAWSDMPLPLTEVKAISKAYACSINDILMASVAGALRRYLLEQGDTVAADCELRAMVPVNLRREKAKQKLGNEFGLVPLVLPIGIEDPIARLREVQRRMAELKGSYTALVAMSLLGVLGSTPRQVQTEIQDFFSRKASAVMSNVPGPRSALYLAGSKLEQSMFWVPQSGDIGMGISILSYDGGVQFGIVTDEAMSSQPDQIIRHFAPEFEKLVLLKLMDESW